MRVAIWLVLMIWSGNAMSSQFYVVFNNCKNTVGYMANSSNNLQIIEGIRTALQCIQSTTQVDCLLAFANDDGKFGEFSKKVSYKIKIDSGTTLMVDGIGISEVMYFDRQKNTAILRSGVMDESDKPMFMGSKVCTGNYFTEFELKAIPNP